MLLVAILVCVLPPRLSAQTGQLVQWAAGDGGAATSSITRESSNSTPGNLILVFSHWDNQTVSVTSVTDGYGNTYVPLSGPLNSGPSARFQAWYAKDIIGGAPINVTVTYSSMTTSYSLVDVAEYTGLDISAPVDVVATATGSGTSMDSGPITTTTPNETIVGLFGLAFSGTPFTPGTGFTPENGNSTSFLEDKSVAAVGTFDATAAPADSDIWGAYIIGFKVALQPVVQLALNPQTVAGGFTSTGTVTLGTPAPAGGATVNLSSDNTAAATVPPSVLVVEGSTVATFTVNTNSVGASTLLNISAMYNSATVPATLAVVPVNTSPQYTIWSVSTVPTVADDGGTSAEEVGVKFTADTSGFISGILFYKSAANTGTHIGNLWSSSGKLLATATFTGETASGWQKVSFSTPVAIIANAVYVASYHTGTGHVSDDNNYFTSVGFDNSPLHAPASGAVGGNGVELFSSSSGFPTTTNLDSNYYVDVVFLTTPSPPVMSLSLSPTSVSSGSTSTGTVTLGSPAPGGGASVALASNNAAASVPASVTVAAGATVATFTINTNAASTTQATISATYYWTQIATLTVTPPAVTVSSVSMSPSTVTGGMSTTGTVVLSGPAPSGGVIVTLSSGNTAVATVPASVMVGAGLTSATFPVSTSSVAVYTGVLISGMLGTTHSGWVLVAPANAGATGQMVQWAAGDSGAALSSTTYQQFNATTGNLVLVFSHWDNQSLTASAGDNLGNTYIPVSGPVNAGASSRFQAWYAKNINGGQPLAVTVTYSGTTTSYSLVDVVEYVGLDKNAPVDVVATAAGSGLSQSSGPTATTTALNETIIGLFGYSLSASAFTAGTGFTFEQYDATSFLEDQSVTSLGSYTATATSNGSTTWAAFGIALKNAVQPPSVLSVSLNPTAVTGGATSTGTVTLNEVAPSGGTTVNLSSSDPSASVPASVLVSGGTTTATFTVTTLAVGSATNPVITATLNGTATATLTVNPPSVTTVTLNPTSVTGGLANSTGTVTLNGAAPTAGISVGLSSSDPSASVPASVTVPGGMTSAPFTATTIAVGVVASPVITATLNGTATATLTVKPPAVMTVTLNPTSVVGGLANSTGTVTLNAAAPTAGISVGLSSSDPSASVLASVTVPGEMTSATFTVTSNSVNAITSSVITVTLNGTATATLTVDPVGVSTVSMSPAAVTGGASSTGTVTLFSPAPTGGATVNLSSSNAAVIVPSTVTVAGGSTTATFTAITIPVSAPTPVTITGVYAGTGSGVLTVNPPGVSSVSLSPSTVTGGLNSTGTITLTGQAPAGGATVTLTSNNSAAAAVPANVTVPQGAISATFTAATSPVASATAPIITAAYAGSQQTGTVTVIPPVMAAVNLIPQSVTGGVISNATVTLTGPAPTGGMSVSLSSDNPGVASVPSSVTVTGGQTVSPVFSITTTVVGTTAVANISGNLGGTVSSPLIVEPTLSLASISVSQTVVTGGTQLTGTATLTNPAPSGGAMVTLSGNNNNVAFLDPSVTIPAGMTSATFGVYSNFVTSSAAVTFTGSFNGNQTTVLIVNPAGVNPVSVFPNSVTPPASDLNNPTTPGEYGLEFYSLTDGYIVGIRFYKGTLNTGTHVGNLWSAAGRLLATATFVNETASGWQSVYFPNPVHITAHTTYVASYYNPSGEYSATVSYFALGNYIDAAPLEVPADTLSTPNGLYAFGTTSSFPNQTINSTNYYVDVILDPTPTNLAVSTTLLPGGFQTGFYNESVVADGGAQPYTFTLVSGNLPNGLTLSPSGLISGVPTGSGYSNFTVQVKDSGTPAQTITQPFGLYIAPSNSCPCSVYPNFTTPPKDDSTQNTPGEYGVRFMPEVDGYVTGIRFYKEPDNTGNHIGNLWTTAGQLLGTVTFSSETPSGWQEANFPTSVHVTANTLYIVSYYSSTGNYDGAAGYFANGNYVDSTPLELPGDSLSTPNGVYAYGPSSAFPANTTQSTNYYVDLVFSASPDPIISSISLNPSSVVGGTPSTGTVNLTQTTLADETVTLTSDNPQVASVPATVTVPAGASSVNFTVTTFPVGGDGVIKITAFGNGMQSAGLTVTTPVLTSVAVNPSTIDAGYAVTGTVTLDVPAGVGNVVVTLSSNNPAVTVPGSVTVFEGSMSATFGISTSAVAAITPVTITATAGTTQTTTLTVNPFTLAIEAVNLNPTTVTGGSSSTGTVVLNGPAPFGGTTVPLSSSSTSAQVPASVVVPAGASSANFQITTSAVSSVTPATISGMLNGTQSAILTITDPPVTSAAISLKSASVTGGSSVTGTVTLNARAPAGGISVALSSNNAAAAVPPSIIVAAGATNATFTVATSAVTSITTTTITATFNGKSTAKLTIHPPAILSVKLNPTTVIGGSKSSTGTVTLTGPAPVGGISVGLLSSDSLAATVLPAVEVIEGATTATFPVTTAAVASPTRVSISATFNGGTRNATLVVNPPALSKMALNPTSVTHPSPSSGTITLSGAAPAGGFVISLKSSNPSVASVPATVTIPAGSSTAKFTVTTKAAAPGNGEIAITASETWSTSLTANLKVK